MGLDDGWRDEVANTVVTGATTNDVSIRVCLRPVNVALEGVERGLVDDRAHEVPEVGHIPVGYGFDLAHQLIA